MGNTAYLRPWGQNELVWRGSRRALKQTAVVDGRLQPGEEAESQTLNLEGKNEGLVRPEKGPRMLNTRESSREYRHSPLAKERGWSQQSWSCQVLGLPGVSI